MNCAALHQSHTVSLLSVDSTWPVVVGGVSAPCSHALVGRRRRTQSSDHLHHVRQHHVTRADCSAAFQDRTVGLLLYVQVRFDGHRPPTTHRVYGDLLVVRTEREDDKGGLLDIELRIKYHIYMKSTCKHLLLDVDKNPEHVLVDLEPLEQSGFTVNDRNKMLVTFHAENIWYQNTRWDVDIVRTCTPDISRSLFHNSAANRTPGRNTTKQRHQCESDSLTCIL